MEESNPAREARGGDLQIGLAFNHVRKLGMPGNAKTKHMALQHGYVSSKEQNTRQHIWISVL
jgi:hypothetical protein